VCLLPRCVVVLRLLSWSTGQACSQASPVRRHDAEEARRRTRSTRQTGSTASLDGSLQPPLTWWFEATATGLPATSARRKQALVPPVVLSNEVLPGVSALQTARPNRDMVRLTLPLHRVRDKHCILPLLAALITTTSAGQGPQPLFGAALVGPHHELPGHPQIFCQTATLSSRSPPPPRMASAAGTQVLFGG
jgi:hypothetical protein